MPEAVIPHLVSSTRQDVLQESSHELHNRQGRRLPLLLFTILITERHLTAFDADQSAIGKGHAVDIPREVL